jgi:hypothetical protein
MKQGIDAHRNGWLKQNQLLGALWIGLIGFFIIGLVESNLGGIEMRTIFLITAACFTGLYREAHTAKAVTEALTATNRAREPARTSDGKATYPLHL